MAEAIKLVPRRKVYRDGVLETVRNARRLVKDENIVGVAIAAVDAEGYTHTLYEPGENYSLIVGAVERLKYRILKRQDELPDV